MTHSKMPRIRDTIGRALGSLRISVTDRCNIRCEYCMPEEDYIWLPKESLLTFEETKRLVDVFSLLGVSKIRITGGEPLLRKDLPNLVAQLASNPRISDLALTTNGILLATFAEQLREAGLHRVTVSLDTLRHERFQAFTRSSRHADVLVGITAAREIGFTGLKVNSVVIRGYNDDELVDLIEFGRAEGVEVRFIEYMDVGGATSWSMDKVVSRQEIVDRLAERYGPIEPALDKDEPAAPADRFRLPDGLVFGIIASTTDPFCGSCDRSRLTADGMWYLCLYARDGVDLKERLRLGAPDSELAELIRETWQKRKDRGAEERLAAPDRGVLYQIESLRSDPHLEMHTRGG